MSLEVVALLSKLFDEETQIVRQFRCKSNQLVCMRVDKRQTLRVQRLPGKAYRHRRAFRLVNRLADERKPGFGKMNANLMCASGLQPYLDECGGAQSLQYTILRAPQPMLRLKDSSLTCIKDGGTGLDHPFPHFAPANLRSIFMLYGARLLWSRVPPFTLAFAIHGR